MKILSHYQEILLTSVEVGERLRPVSDAVVQMIRISVEQQGQITTPIRVRKMKAGQFRLIDGGHRLAVAQLLGHEVIPCQVWECTGPEARLMEGDANLALAHLTPLDLAVGLADRKQAYVALHPETAAGVFKGNRYTGKQVTEMSFANFMAEVFGLTSRQIHRMIATGEALDREDIRLLRRAPRRIAMAHLMVLAKISDVDERAAVIEAIAEGKKAAAARKAYLAAKNGTAPTVKDPAEDGFKALIALWERVPKASKRRFSGHFAAELQELIDQAHGEGQE